MSCKHENSTWGSWWNIFQVNFIFLLKNFFILNQTFSRRRFPLINFRISRNNPELNFLELSESFHVLLEFFILRNALVQHWRYDNDLLPRSALNGMKSSLTANDGMENRGEVWRIERENCREFPLGDDNKVIHLGKIILLMAQWHHLCCCLSCYCCWWWVNKRVSSGDIREVLSSLDSLRKWSPFHSFESDFSLNFQSDFSWKFIL